MATMDKKAMEEWSLISGYDTGFKSTPKDMDANWLKLLARPRVIKAKDILPSLSDGFTMRIVDTSHVGLASLQTFFEEFPPGGVSQRHGHMNSAIFFIMEGRGYELHDGMRFDWEAGDAVLVPVNCVHRHVNADPKKPAVALVVLPRHFTLKGLNLWAQRMVDHPGEGDV